MSQQQIEGQLKDSAKRVIFSSQQENSIAPGGLAHHYQPDFPLILGDHEVKWTQKLHKKICHKLNIENSAIPALWKFKQDDPKLVARHLYEEMREKNQQGTYTYLQLPQHFEETQWDAIRDRTQKASSFKVIHLHGEIALIDKNQY